MKRDDYRDYRDYREATILRTYLKALPRFQRENYLQDNPSYRADVGDDLTHAQWKEYGALRRARGTDVAHAFAVAVRRAAWLPTYAPGVDGGHPIAAFFAAIFFVCVGIAGAACALIWYMNGA